VTSSEEDQRLTQSGRGTPCGELMRRYWQPAALSEELEADKPLPVQLFGEELILFRDHQGKPALIGRYCAHQGVDMIYARVEPDGIRCMYHGWLFDPCGKVVVRGDWLLGGEQRIVVGQPAYPCVEVGGVIFTYMGSGEPPAQPFTNLSARFPPTRVLRAENYLQGILCAHEAPPDDARFVVPNVVGFLRSQSGGESWMRWHVPMDDNSHAEFTLGSFGAVAVIGEKMDAAQQILLKAIEEFSTERSVSSESGAKDL
jgi:nitrite reductase/ring-hydroxylating ferredoxin subunit